MCATAIARLKASVAASLALWLGALACVLGCAQPLAAAAPANHQARPSQCRTADSADDPACCHRGQNNPRQNHTTPQSPSCCPAGATVLQKQTRVPSPQNQILLLAVAALEPATLPFHRIDLRPVGPPAGRDLLQRIRVLRI